MILFCLPYAGGSSAIYSSWRKYIDPSINFHPIELSGRGTRYREPLYKHIYEMVDDVFEQIKEYIEDNPYAIFGHSMGSLIAYELSHKIKKMGIADPVHVFFSGYKAPNAAKEREEVYRLPDEEFKFKVKERGGTPDEFFEHKELLDIFIPILRADFEAVETFEYVERDEKLSFDISIINGKDDEMTFDEIMQWKNHTSAHCKVYMLDGDHFFINDNAENITKIINYTLADKNL